MTRPRNEESDPHEEFDRHEEHDTQAAPPPAREDVAVTAIPGMKPAYLLVLLAFAGFSLLLPVVPLAVLRSGGSDALAGATTGVFMVVTVLFQVLTPRVTMRLGYKPSLLLGSALLGLPSVLLLLGLDGSAGAGADDRGLGAGAAALVLAVSAVRGAGFGMMTVSGSALVAELAPPGKLGRATSMVGLAIGLSEMLFLPAGLALFDRVGLGPVAWLASGLGLVGLATSAGLRSVRPHAAEHGTSDDVPVSSLVGALVPPFLIMIAVSLPYGATSSFLAPALAELEAPGRAATVGGLALGVLGGSVILGRTYAGRVSDREGPGRLVVPGLVLAALGMAGVTVLLLAEGSPWWAVLPCLVFGVGFGVVQNEALVTSFEAVPRTRIATASASWNISFDAGTGLGSLVLGLVAGWGYAALFATAAVVVAGVGASGALAGRRRRTRPLG